MDFAVLVYDGLNEYVINVILLFEDIETGFFLFYCCIPNWLLLLVQTLYVYRMAAGE